MTHNGSGEDATPTLDVAAVKRIAERLVTTMFAEIELIRIENGATYTDREDELLTAGLSLALEAIEATIPDNEQPAWDAARALERADPQ